MLISYPAFFYYSDSEEGYYIHFPDFENSATQGDSLEEALEMASEYLGILLAHYIEAGEDLPLRSEISTLSLRNQYPFMDSKQMEHYYNFDKSFISMIMVNVSDYLDSGTLIKKTLTIPKWANDLGNRLQLNFSKELTDVIAEKSVNYQTKQTKINNYQ